MNRHLAAPGALLVALLLSACSTSEPEAIAPPEETTSVSPEAEVVDLTSNLLDANTEATWVQSVESAIQTEPGRVEVTTTIVDPRTDDSPEAADAVAICEATVEVSEAESVQVLEEDSTIFVVFGNPRYPDGCTEV